MSEVDTSFFDRVHDIYEIGDRMGTTDYIDFLTFKEVPKNIMKGVDCYGRKFLTLKVGGFDIDNNIFFKTGQVFFERYNDAPYIVGAQFDGNMFIWTTGGTRPEQYKLINDLVDGKPVILKEEHKFNSSKHNCIVASMDYWEHRFAKVIQKNFLIARYKPKYKICNNVLNRQFDEYSESLTNIQNP